MMATLQNRYCHLISHWRNGRFGNLYLKEVTTKIIQNSAEISYTSKAITTVFCLRLVFDTMGTLGSVMMIPLMQSLAHHPMGVLSLEFPPLPPMYVVFAGGSCLCVAIGEHAPLHLRCRRSVLNSPLCISCPLLARHLPLPAL